MELTTKQINQIASAYGVSVKWTPEGECWCTSVVPPVLFDVRNSDVLLFLVQQVITKGYGRELSEEVIIHNNTFNSAIISTWLRMQQEGTQIYPDDDQLVESELFPWIDDEVYYD